MLSVVHLTPASKRFLRSDAADIADRLDALAEANDKVQAILIDYGDICTQQSQSGLGDGLEAELKRIRLELILELRRALNMQPDNCRSNNREKPSSKGGS